MNEHAVERLFEEFAQAYRRGESPDVAAYLARAGGERESLGELIDRFLQAVPAQPATEEEVVLMQARLVREGPLFVLRKRRGLRREAVVEAILGGLGLERAKRAKVARYYHELETGLLEPAPVDASIWDVLSRLLGANARELASAFRPLPPAAEPARRRADEDFVLPEPAAVPPPAEHEEERDEVDRLFTGAS